MAGQRTSAHRKLLGEVFIEKSKVLYPDQLSYGKVEYHNETTPVVLNCVDHGEFKAIPKSHLKRGKCCPRCAEISYRKSRGFSASEVLEKFRCIHGNKYIYDMSQEFYNNQDSVEITCPDHGEFTQTVASHKTGSGCRTCGYVRAGGEGSYNETIISRLKEYPESRLYILEMDDLDGTKFFKVGITCKPLHRRLSCLRKYNPRVVMTNTLPLNESHELEQLILSVCNAYKTVGKFSGHTECFTSHNIALTTLEAN